MKTMENQRQFCQHSKLFFLQGRVAPVFLSFPSLMGKNIRDIKRHFEGKNDACLEVPWIVYFYETL